MALNLAMFVALLGSLSGPSLLSAAEIVFKPTHYAGGSLITLGDLAEIYTQDADRRAALARIELFPAPPAGRQRTVRLREIQDLLSLRSVDLVGCRFSGASVVEVHGQAIQGPTTTRRVAEQRKPLSLSTVQQVEQAVADAVARHLATAANSRATWRVDVKLNVESARIVAALGGPLLATGGEQPWLGPQRFVLRGAAGGEPVEINADVSLPEMIVVAARSLQRGETVTKSDVELQAAPRNTRLDGHVQDLQEVVGLETTRAIPQGLVITDSYVRRPILVRRNEVVTVYVRASGLSIRTEARAMDNGSRGDLVAVQSLLNREKFSARVVDIQEVEVMAAGISTRGDAPERRQPAQPAMASTPVTPITPVRLNTPLSIR